MPDKKYLLAKVTFADAKTGKNYKPGDEVTGWDAARRKLYKERGLVYETTELPNALREAAELEAKLKLAAEANNSENPEE
jgi:hypothetical protein